LQRCKGCTEFNATRRLPPSYRNEASRLTIYELGPMIKSNDHLVWELASECTGCRGVFNSEGSDDHSVNTMIKEAKGSIAISDAPAYLNWDTRNFNDLAHDGLIVYLSTTSSIKIDDVEHRRTLIDKGRRLLNRVAIDRLFIEVSA
jgi:hypothetical protein